MLIGRKGLWLEKMLQLMLSQLRIFLGSGQATRNSEH